MRNMISDWLSSDGICVIIRGKAADVSWPLSPSADSETLFNTFVSFGLESVLTIRDRFGNSVHLVLGMLSFPHSVFLHQVMNFDFADNYAKNVHPCYSYNSALY